MHDDEAPALTGALLCAECGRLEWPTDAAPHRTEQSTGSTRRDPCPHCAEHAWIDLRLESTALAVRQTEERAGTDPTLVRDVLPSAMLGLLNGGFAWVIFPSYPLSAAAIAVLTTVAAAAYAIRQRRRSMPPPRPLPDRWSLALPPAGSPTHSLSGRAKTTETMTSPLTGRPCIAWEVGLRRDDDPDAPLPTWALLEQTIAPIEVDGTPLDPDRTFLDVPRERLGKLAPNNHLDDAALAWLRDRGFAPEAAPLTIYETILPPDVDVRATFTHDRAVLGCR